MLLALVLGAGACGAQGLSAPHSLLTTQTPAMIHLKDGPTTEYELGVRFKSDATGEIRAIRFWKDLYERGTHVGRIWSATGTQLATVTFDNETASGWQQQALPTPLRIQTNVEYMVSVNTASGFYVATNDSASQLRNGNLASVVESNGRYGPVGAYPAQSFRSSNYFRDVVFAAAESSSTNAGSGSSGSSGGTPTDAGTGSSGGTTPNADGIAARYPGDVGIEKDPNVVFADGFESYAQASDLWNKWNNYYQASQTRITTDPANVRTGTKALEFTMPQGSNELTNAIQQVLTTELDVLYLRYYSKFAASFNVIGSSHQGGGINAHYYYGFNATPGIPANGTNKFFVEYECWRGSSAEGSPGQLNVYVYHPEQRSNYGDHFFPTGMILPDSSRPHNFGPEFVSRPNVTPELDRWYAYEMMVKANTPGKRDGRITIWLDGKVIGDFPNLRLRDVDTLKIDRFNLSLGAMSNTSGATKKWYDNVVAAKSYIGPMVP